MIEHTLNGVPQPIINKRITVPMPINWPLLLQPMKQFAKPGDKGLGDIIERIVGPVGGDAYKMWYKKVFGKPCKCNKHQDNLNEQFPL